MKHQFSFRQTDKRRGKTYFAVSQKASDGTLTPVGTVIHWWVEHLQMVGWEAIGSDGHRAVHKTKQQAAMALIWDGQGYPFPVTKS